MSDFVVSLRKLGACSEAVEWAKGYPTLQAAWDACERADWMLWLVARVDGEIRPVTRLAMCACARTALRYVPAGEDQPLRAIETGERFARGEATAEEMADARADAGAVMADDWATVAAYWATVAAESTGDAGAAWVAAGAAWVARNAALAGVCARCAAHREMAAIVREHIPVAPKVEGSDE